MNAKQYAKASNTIINDATLSGKNFDDYGNRCVIGGLCHDAGIIIPEQNRSSGVTCLPVRIKEELKQVYGLSIDDLKALQEINDSTYEVDSRRQKLLAKLVECLKR